MFGQERRITRPEDAAALRITYFSEDDIDLGVSQDESIARSLMSGGWGAEVDFDDEVAALRDTIGVLGKFQVKAKSILGKVDALSGGGARSPDHGDRVPRDDLTLLRQSS